MTYGDLVTGHDLVTAAVPLPLGLRRDLPEAASLLDPDWLSQQWGGRVRGSYLRYKAGTSLLLALRTPQGPAWGLCHRDPAKVGKLRTRAERRALPIVPLGETAAVGPAALDRAVGPGLRALRASVGGLAGGGLTSGAVPLVMRTLRYNPGRRLVVQLGSAREPTAVARITRPGRPLHAELLAALHDAGLAAPVLSADPGRGVVVLGWRPGQVRDWVSATEQQAVTAVLDQLAQAGALARGHRLPRYDPRWWRGALAQVRAAVGALDPGLGSRAEQVTDRLAMPEAGPLRLVHGDLSADQIVWQAGRPSLIDFDRVGWGPRWLDPAVLLATECLRHADLAAADGASATVRRGAAHAVLRRATEPFRMLDPEWPTAVARRLDLAQELAR